MTAATVFWCTVQTNTAVGKHTMQEFEGMQLVAAYSADIILMAYTHLSDICRISGQILTG